MSRSRPALLEHADVDVREQPRVRGADRHQRDPEPARVVVALPARLLGQDPDDDRGVAEAADLRVLDREEPVLQAVGEAGQPLLPGQDEAQRPDASEVRGQEAVQERGVVRLFGGRLALHQVEHAIRCCHEASPLA
jgi:hypothetical protein